MLGSVRAARRRRNWTALAALTMGLAWAVPAEEALAAPGYEPDAITPSISTTAEVPRGVAIDQVSQMLYVTELVENKNTGGPGRIEQFTPSGTLTPQSPFGTGGADFFIGGPVNPVDPGIYPDPKGGTGGFRTTRTPAL